MYSATIISSGNASFLRCNSNSTEAAIAAMHDLTADQSNTELVYVERATEGRIFFTLLAVLPVLVVSLQYFDGRIDLYRQFGAVACVVVLTAIMLIFAFTYRCELRINPVNKSYRLAKTWFFWRRPIVGVITDFEEIRIVPEEIQGNRTGTHRIELHWRTPDQRSFKLHAGLRLSQVYAVREQFIRLLNVPVTWRT